MSPLNDKLSFKQWLPGRDFARVNPGARQMVNPDPTKDSSRIAEMTRREWRFQAQAVFPNPTERGLGKQGDFGSDGLCRSAFHDRSHHRECRIGVNYTLTQKLAKLPDDVVPAG